MLQSDTWYWCYNIKTVKYWENTVRNWTNNMLFEPMWYLTILYYTNTTWQNSVTSYKYIEQWLTIRSMTTCTQWKGINRKQSTRWQHLSRLKASAFFSLQIFLVVMKHSNLYLGLVLPSGGWQSLISQSISYSKKCFKRLGAEWHWQMEMK
jgi:hypothetical protein